MKTVTLYYVHDPMCAWCYGFQKSYKKLTQSLPQNVQLKTLLGGLAPDSNEPMPENIRNYVQENWRRIEVAIPGVKFNYDFWQRCQPRRSTYPACRAVISARKQDPFSEYKMIEAIQHAYYQQARNPSDIETLIQLAIEIGLNGERFEADLNSDLVNETLVNEIKQARDIGGNSFPSLFFESEGGIAALPVDYNNPDNMLDVIQIVSRDVNATQIQ